MPGTQRLALRQNGWPCDDGRFGMAPDIMKRFLVGTLALAAGMAVLPTIGHAEEGGIDKARAEAFDARIFTKPPGKKAYACFVRRYDAEHLARHPQQKVSAMKLLMTAEIPSDENTLNYSFRLGVKFRHRSGDFDSSGSCGHVIAEDSGHEIRFGCGVDCDGGGIGVALSTTNPRSSGWSGCVSGRTAGPTRKPVIRWSPAPTTRCSGSTASRRANALPW
jgi:hypothetical protein